MNEASLFQKLYNHSELRNEIYFYFKPKSRLEEIKYSNWKELVNSESLDVNYEQLFYVFDMKGVRIGILPNVKNEYWSFRIYTKVGILIANDFVSRKEATLSALNRAITLFDELNLNNNATRGSEQENIDVKNLFDAEGYSPKETR